MQMFCVVVVSADGCAGALAALGSRRAMDLGLVRDSLATADAVPSSLGTLLARIAGLSC